MTAAVVSAEPVPREQQIPGQLSGAAVGFGVMAVILGGLATAGAAFIVDSGVGVGIISAICGVGLGVLVTCHAALLRRRMSVPGFSILGVGVRFGYFLLGATALSFGLTTAQQVSSEPQVVRLVDGFGFTVLSAMAGVCAGIAAMVVAVASPEDRDERGRSGFAVGIAVAVAGSMMVTVAVQQSYMHAGKWSPTVAGEVDVPERPGSVGEVAYRIRLTETPELVLGLGAGFLVRTGSLLTAYDGLSGKPRWHADFSGIGTDSRPVDDVSYAESGGHLRVRSGPVLLTLDEVTGAVVETERVDEDSYRSPGLPGARRHGYDELDLGDGIVSASKGFASGTWTFEVDYRSRKSGETTRTVIPIVTGGDGEYHRPNVERVGRNVVVTGREKLFVVDPNAGRVISEHTNPCSVEGDSRPYAVPGALLVWCRPDDGGFLKDPSIFPNEIVGLVPSDS